MAKKKVADIEEIIKQKWLVEFNRKPLEKISLFGFILACNDEFTLIQEFDRDLFILDGYSVFQNNSVKKYKVYDDEHYFLCEVVKLKKLKPKPIPQVSIENWTEILRTANENFPLIRIEQEKINNKACNIGKIKTIKKKTFKLLEVDTCADWDGSFDYKLKDLTKVRFGSQYENTLALVVENREKSDF